jgi:transcriptional regulator with XRE-family HTH domain
MEKPKLGQMIRERRRTMWLSQRELAARVGVKGSFICYIENGGRRPSLGVLTRLADTLGIDERELLLLSHPEAKSLIIGNASAAPAENAAESWRRLLNNRKLRTRYRITRREIAALRQLSLLGYVLTQREFLAILMLIRQP